MLVCVRWYAAYPLSLRHIEEMMIERGVFVDHSTVHRWALKISPVLALVFRRRERPVGGSWRMDETYVKVCRHWKYLYRAVDRDGHTVDVLLGAHRDEAAARRFLERRSRVGAGHRFLTRDRRYRAAVGTVFFSMNPRFWLDLPTEYDMRIATRELTAKIAPRVREFQAATA
jgi:transposase-like protein